MDLLISLVIALVSGLFVLLALAPLLVSSRPVTAHHQLRVVARSEPQPPVKAA